MANDAQQAQLLASDNGENKGQDTGPLGFVLVKRQRTYENGRVVDLILVRGFFVPHCNPLCGIDLDDPSQWTIFEYAGVGRLEIFLRPGPLGGWNHQVLCPENPLVTIRPGWQIAGHVLGGTEARFRLHAHASYGDASAVVRVADAQWPESMRRFVETIRMGAE